MDGSDKNQTDSLNNNGLNTGVVPPTPKGGSSVPPIASSVPNPPDNNPPQTALEDSSQKSSTASSIPVSAGIANEIPTKPPPVPPDVVTVKNEVKNESLPLWFYILFTFVSIVFFVITALLVTTLIKQQREEVLKPQVTTDLKETVQSLKEPSQTPAPQDEYLSSLNEINESDNLDLIEDDLNKTDLTPLRQDLDSINLP